MAVWVPEIECGHNGVSKLFCVLKLSSLINPDDAVRVSGQGPRTPQSCW
jgi:hypothetical protein